MSRELKRLLGEQEKLEEKIAAERKRMADEAKREVIPQRYTDAFLQWTYDGRVIEESQDPGYAGTCSFEHHCKQMNVPSGERAFHINHAIERWSNARLNAYLDDEERAAGIPEDA